jgi:hypothetical protein
VQQFAALALILAATQMVAAKLEDFLPQGGAARGVSRVRQGANGNFKRL